MGKPQPAFGSGRATTTGKREPRPGSPRCDAPARITRAERASTARRDLYAQLDNAPRSRVEARPGTTRGTDVGARPRRSESWRIDGRRRRGAVRATTFGRHVPDTPARAPRVRDSTPPPPRGSRTATSRRAPADRLRTVCGTTARALRQPPSRGPSRRRSWRRSGDARPAPRSHLAAHAAHGSSNVAVTVPDPPRRPASRPDEPQRRSTRRSPRRADTGPRARCAEFPAGVSGTAPSAVALTLGRRRETPATPPATMRARPRRTAPRGDRSRRGPTSKWSPHRADPGLRARCAEFPAGVSGTAPGAVALTLHRRRETAATPPATMRARPRRTAPRGDRSRRGPTSKWSPRRADPGPRARCAEFPGGVSGTAPGAVALTLHRRRETAATPPATMRARPRRTAPGGDRSRRGPTSKWFPRRADPGPRARCAEFPAGVSGTASGAVALTLHRRRETAATPPATMRARPRRTAPRGDRSRRGPTSKWSPRRADPGPRARCAEFPAGVSGTAPGAVALTLHQRREIPATPRATMRARPRRTAPRGDRSRRGPTSKWSPRRADPGPRARCAESPAGVSGTALGTVALTLHQRRE